MSEKTEARRKAAMSLMRNFLLRPEPEDFDEMLNLINLIIDAVDEAQDEAKRAQHE